MQTKNESLVDELLKFIEPKPKACWRNSLNAWAALHVTSKDSRYREKHYVEGWVILPQRLGGIPITHGWLEVDGQIVDVTMRDIEAGDYYPVFRFDRARLLEELDRNPRLPIHDNDREMSKRIFLAMPFLTDTMKEKVLG